MDQSKTGHFLNLKLDTKVFEILLQNRCTAVAMTSTLADQNTKGIGFDKQISSKRSFFYGILFTKILRSKSLPRFDHNVKLNF